MLHNTNSAVFQHCSKSPFLKGFAKFALRSVATIIDKIRRISVETMSNIPENHHVNFISILCQKAFTKSAVIFWHEFDPPNPNPVRLNNTKKTARSVRWGTPNYKRCHKFKIGILSGVVDLFGGRLLIFVLCDVNCKDPPRYRFSPLSTFSRTLLNKHSIDDVCTTNFIYLK